MKFFGNFLTLKFAFQNGQDEWNTLYNLNLYRMGGNDIKTASENCINKQQKLNLTYPNLTY